MMLYANIYSVIKEVDIQIRLKKNILIKKHIF